MNDFIHPHDKEWYLRQIRSLPPFYRRKAEDGYMRAFMEAFDAEESEHKKSNAGRRAANIRLREYVEKVTGQKGKQKEVSKNEAKDAD